MATSLSTKSKIFYVNTLIIILIIASIIIVDHSIDYQLLKIENEVNNISEQIDANIKSGQDALYYLKTTIENENLKLNDIKINYVNKIHPINNKGNYALNISGMANITGFDGISNDLLVRKEMEMSIGLTPFFKIVKERNQNYAWVYYLSKNKFDTSYPYSSSNNFTYFEKNTHRELWTKALPKNNPNKELFFTQLYFDGAGLGLMVTLGQPIYSKNDFLGTIDIDITLKTQNDILHKNNISKGSYYLINKENQIIAAERIEGFNDKKIFTTKDIIPKAIIPQTDNKSDIRSEGLYYIYGVSLKNAPWKLHYYKNRFLIYLEAMYYILGILLMLIVLFKLRTLVIELEKSNEELALLASTDPMTKLYNRRYFSKISTHIFDLSIRDNKDLSLIMLDIDKFKLVNDTYGHHIGDEVIISLANNLIKNTRKSDITARFGGEEFLILLPETSSEQALIVAEKIRKDIESTRLYFEDDITLSFTISLGISSVKKEDSSIEMAIARADNALYKAKESGRNKVVCH